MRRGWKLQGVVVVCTRFRPNAGKRGNFCEDGVHAGLAMAGRVAGGAGCVVKQFGGGGFGGWRAGSSAVVLRRRLWG